MLKKTGGRVTNARALPDWNEIAATVAELRLELAKAVRKRRVSARMTQLDLGRAIRSTQAHIAKLEAAHPEASLESMVRALIAAGARVQLRVVRKTTKKPVQKRPQKSKRKLR
jgi:predicted transcriptional regulator